MSEALSGMRGVILGVGLGVLAAKKAGPLAKKADTLFKGETLRSILLNAYGWWTVATIALYVGIAFVIAGIVMAVLAFLGFRHARASAPVAA